MLIYCTKAKPYLSRIWKNQFELATSKEVTEQDALNGKIVAEFDGEVEEIKEIYCCGCLIQTKTMCHEELLGRSRLTDEEFDKYNPNYAIHIKNLKIFDKPKELSDYFTFTGASNNLNNLKPVKKMVQNMMKVYELKDDRTKYPNILLANYILKPCIIISFDPESARDILNGIKTVDIKNKILKEMKER